MTVKCGWAAINERGTVRGGKAGDQTGGEVKTGNWYNFGQNVVLRFKNRDVAKKAVTAMKRICANNHIGYDWDRRSTLWTEGKKVGYQWDKIQTNCDTDCSSTIGAIFKGMGYNVPTYIYTGNMVSLLKATGAVTVLYGSKYTKSDQYLMAGDIIVNEAKHVIMALENGSKASVKVPSRKKKTYTGTKFKLNKHSDGQYLGYGDGRKKKDANVVALQKFLNWRLDAGLAVDGVYGNATKAAVTQFQTLEKITKDGYCGKITKGKADEWYK